jgi:regulation of enolase protein 1 (concanavalin A-like superfamily)
LEGIKMKEFDVKQLFWVSEPKEYMITESDITIVTEPWTDLWQRTYYGFQHDNAPVLQIKSEEKYFTFSVKTEFHNKGLFEQCGIAVYLDSDNWAKASCEYENVMTSKLGSVVTNNGYSDWATTDIPSGIHQLYYRLSRRESDFLVETSEDGIDYKQMRIFHLIKGAGEVSFGVYACSPLDSSFKARFSEMRLMECIWEGFQE